MRRSTRLGPAEFVWQLPLSIPSGSAGLTALGDRPQPVPGRHAGRVPEHRERYTVFFFLHALLRTRPELFPAILRKSEAPDFVLSCGNGVVLGIEHRDLASSGDQRWLANPSRETGIRHLPSAGDGAESGWTGNAPERAWQQAFEEATAAKADLRIWRNAPAKAERWLLLKDEVLAPADDAAKPALMRQAVASTTMFRIAVVSDAGVALDPDFEWQDPLAGDGAGGPSDVEFERLCNDPDLAAAIAAAEAEVAAGYVVPHAEVMRSLDAIIEAARRAHP